MKIIHTIKKSVLHKWPYGFVFFMIIFLLTFFLAGTAFAHKVMIFAYVDGDTVYTKSKFSGGKKAKNSQVIVYNQQGNKLLEGKTDNNGEFSFKVPQKTTLKIVLNAGMGHRGQWTIPVEEIERQPKEIADSNQDSTGKKISEAKAAPKAQNVTATGLTLPEVQEVVEKVLEKKLRPIMKMLAESNEKEPEISDILGGIGYIFGLMGVASYFHFRKKNK